MFKNKSIDIVHNIFKNRKSKPIGEFKKSAVLILLHQKNNETNIIFEVRSYNLRHQPGDVCLPGGKVEKGEKTSEAAIRETVEELNVKKEDIEIIGEMDFFISPYNFIIYPFVGILKTTDKIIPNENEVDHIFEVPMDHFIKQTPLSYESEIIPRLSSDFPYSLIRGGKKYKFKKGKINQYFYKYDKYVIWGFTALIIKKFTDIMNDEV
ncbi:CoA pyrophosphatase [Clostridium oceanicum]|uniref:CoA pyrophosphatase n=1 Tax=Clostridium oceanicum TaxID=1543 RepID=A0ABN1JIX4_9CLOT